MHLGVWDWFNEWMNLPAPDPTISLAIARRLLTQPTAPYHEHRVRSELADILRVGGIPTRIDRYGNLIARYRRGRASGVTLAAHMDHPGFEIVSVRGSRARAKWNGQVPTFNLRGLKLAVWSDGPVQRRGTATVLKGDGRTARARASYLSLRVPVGTQPGDFGYADVTPLRLQGNRILAKCHDNVSGCAAIASVLSHLARHRLPGDVTALFTRAEEVGFQGAFGAIRDASIPRSRPLIVLECSKEMPGAQMGKGPVIRVGDRMMVFDPDLVSACVHAAVSLEKMRAGFAWQRRLMDGGVCEASAFVLADFRAICLAFPLGNYHNVGPQGVAAEYIDRRDFINGVDCLAAFAVLGVDPARRRRELQAWALRRFGPKERARLLRSAS